MGDFMRQEDLDFDIREMNFLPEDFSQFFNIFEKIFRFYFFIRNAEGSLTYINPKISKVLGYKPEEFRKNWKKYLTEHPTNKEVILKSEFQKLRGKHIKPYSMEIKNKSGEKIWLEVHEAPVLDLTGNVVKYHGLAIDYTARKAEQEKKEQLIHELLDLKKKLEVSVRTDPLTDLPNRRGLAEKLEYEKIRFDRSKNPFTIIIGDIDHFKEINDTFGHDAGDQILTDIARMLKDNSRKQDIVSRWGGEEFIILLPETDLGNGAILAEKLRNKIEKETFVYQDKEIPVTLSFGLSVFNQKSLEIDDVIKQADKCLYEAKNSGRNKVVLKKSFSD